MSLAVVALIPVILIRHPSTTSILAVVWDEAHPPNRSSRIVGITALDKWMRLILVTNNKGGEGVGVATDVHTLRKEPIVAVHCQVEPIAVWHYKELSDSYPLIN
jgi:hypothetical protein